MFIYYMVINFFDSEKRIAAVAWIIIISTAIFAIKGEINYYVLAGNSLSGRFIPVDGAPINSSAIINLFAVFLSLFYLMRKNRWFIQIGLCICLAGTFMAVILSYSRAALLALIGATAVLVFLISKDKKKFIAILILITVAVATLYGTSGQVRRLRPENLMNNWRLGIYYTSFEIAKDYPIAGVGFGMETFKKYLWQEYNAKVPKKWQKKDPFPTPHSFFFSILVRLGIVGIAIFGFIIFRAFQISRLLLRCDKGDIRIWGSYLSVSFIGMLLAGLFGSILHGAAAYNFYIVLAMMTVFWRLTRQPQDHTASPKN
jgi:O-antigen ligase